MDSAYWAMLSFSLAVSLTAEDEASIEEVVEVAERALLLTNDYFSWERELEQSAIQDDGKIFNSVWFIMKQDGVSANVALQRVKDMILTLEVEFVKLKDQLYMNNPSLPLHIRRWIESCGLAIAGNHYWSATCPRHNDWKSAPQQAPSNHMSISDLAAMGSSDQDFRSSLVSLPNGIISNQPSESQVEKVSDTTHPNKAHRASGASLGDGLLHVHKRDRTNGSCDVGEASQGEKASVVNMEGPRQKRVKPNADKAYTFGAGPKVNSNGESSGIPQANDISDSTSTHINGNGNTRKVDRLDMSAVLAPYNYISCVPSKGFRSSLIETLNSWMKVPPRKLNIVRSVIDMLHSASLILDDIEDNSCQRRGQPSASIVFGPAQAINSSTFLYVRAVQAIRELHNQEATSILIEELENLFLGQSWDLYWKFNLRAPSEEEYFAMIDHKTGGLFRMLVRLMLALSRMTDRSMFNFGVLAQKVGRYFQIRDDYMNLASPTYSKQKGFCEDLDEGKFSYLIVHCLQHSTRCRNHILGIFRQHRMSPDQPLSRECKLHILECLEETGTMQATWKLLNRLEAEIESAIERLEMTTGESNYMLHLLLKKLSVGEMMKPADDG